MIFVTSCNSQGVTSDIPESLQTAEINTETPRKVNITFEGGSGKAHVLSPVTITSKEGKSYATLVFSSKNYDYVKVGGIRFDNENPGGNSTFTVPVDSFDEPFVFIGDTVAMSKPHEIEYTITWLDEAPPGEEEAGEEPAEETDKGVFGVKPDDYKAPDLGNLKPTGSLDIKNAKGFAVTKYGPYSLISIYGVGEYLLVPKGEGVPSGIGADVTVIKQPLSSVYLVSTSVMDLVREIGSLDAVKFCGLDENDWYIDEAKERIRDGRMQYAGKYRAPDYELILSGGCDLAIENTMIFHNPEVKEKLEEMGIPVIVETSSYEKDPLSRLEWIKLYGLLFDKSAEADVFYERASEAFEASKGKESPGRSVAFFFVSESGMINVRTSGDYIATMIEMAGGKYVPDKSAFPEGTTTATMNIQAEDFYASARDADILIYNSTIGGSIKKVSDLIAKNAMFADFKAVKEGNVYCLTDDFFQKTTGAADLLYDLSSIEDGTDRECVFLRKIGD